MKIWGILQSGRMKNYQNFIFSFFRRLTESEFSAASKADSPRLFSLRGNDILIKDRVFSPFFNDSKKIKGLE